MQIKLNFWLRPRNIAIFAMLVLLPKFGMGQTERPHVQGPKHARYDRKIPTPYVDPDCLSQYKREVKTFNLYTTRRVIEGKDNLQYAVKMGIQDSAFVVGFIKYSETNRKDHEKICIDLERQIDAANEKIDSLKTMLTKFLENPDWASLPLDSLRLAKQWLDRIKSLEEELKTLRSKHHTATNQHNVQLHLRQMAECALVIVVDILNINRQNLKATILRIESYKNR